MKSIDRSSTPVHCEPLERRQMLSLVVNSIVADNRGEVTITLNGQLDPDTVNRSSVQLYTAGDDGVLGNADDIKVSAAVGYTPSAKRIVIRGGLPANTPYRVKLVSSRLATMAGAALDGDFHGVLPSGNGKSGGNFEFVAKPDKSNTPTARISTSEGVINIKLYKKLKPDTVSTFLTNADAGAYDNLFWTRSIAGFILQAGALSLNGDDIVQNQVAVAPTTNEFATSNLISNSTGTIAYAKLPDDADSATNEFFVNLADNGGTSPYGLDYQNGGFTVFAKIADGASMQIVKSIAGLPTVALSNPLTGDGVVTVPTNVSVTDTPVNDTNSLNGQLETVEQPVDPYPARSQFVVTSGLDASSNLVTIRRTAELMKVTALK